MEFHEIEGKTIKSVKQVKLPNYDDEGWLLLEFIDGSDCIIEAGYLDYTGNSLGEYPTYIDIKENTGVFVDVPE